MENLTIQTKYDPKFWDEHFGIDNADPHRYATENLRLIDIRGGVRVSNFQSAVPIQPASTNLSVTHDLISSFIDFKCENISNRYLYREPLRKFLAAASIEALGHYTSHPTSKTQRAMLDDRNNQGSTQIQTSSGNSRLFLGSLTASQAYRELLKDRVGLVGIPDAHRRIIYIVNIDPSFALAIAATVSQSQAPALRDFLYTHITCENSLRARIDINQNTFSFIFHFQYYAWRREASDQENQDASSANRMKDSRKLRVSNKVVRFKRSKATTTAQAEFTEHIHHAQISVIVAGLDNRFWTSHCLVDLYFEEDNQVEQVNQLCASHNGQLPKDPNTCGERPLNQPEWDPRHYFLRSLSCRMSQIRREWRNTIYQLKEAIDPCIDAFIENQEQKDGKGKDTILVNQAEFNWSRKTLRDFTHLISKTISCWETFKSGEIGFFVLPEAQAEQQKLWNSLFADIDMSVEELKTLREELVYRTELFETMTSSILTHAAHEESVAAKSQRLMVQVITFLQAGYLPFTLACSLFSMQGNIIPNATTKHWGFVLGMTCLGTVALVVWWLSMGRQVSEYSSAAFFWCLHVLKETFRLLSRMVRSIGRFIRWLMN